MRRELLFAVAAASAVVIPLLSQAPSGQKPSFEVASVKLNVSDKAGGSAGPRGDRFLATNVSLKGLLNFAYRLPNEQLLNGQIVGGPEWTNVDRFDVEAKLGGDTRTIPLAQIQLMLQSLLEDRFQLHAHRETRELPVYDLVVWKGLLKMKMAEDQSPPDPRQGLISFDPSGQETAPLPRGAMRISGGALNSTLLASAVPITKIVSLLQGQADRMVFDKTNLKELFDVRLQFSRESGMAGPDTTEALLSDPAFPSLFTAVQDLGLKLEPSKAPLGVVVVDSVQKLRPN